MERIVEENTISFNVNVRTQKHEYKKSSIRFVCYRCFCLVSDVHSSEKKVEQSTTESLSTLWCAFLPTSSYSLLEKTTQKLTLCVWKSKFYFFFFGVRIFLSLLCVNSVPQFHKAKERRNSTECVKK